MKDPDDIRVLRNGADAANEADVAIALNLKRRGYAEITAPLSKRIGRSGVPIFFEWHGRTALGDAYLAEHNARIERSSVRGWLAEHATAAIVATIATFAGGALLIYYATP